MIRLKCIIIRCFFLGDASWLHDRRALVWKNIKIRAIRIISHLNPCVSPNSASATALLI